MNYYTFFIDVARSHGRSAHLTRVSAPWLQENHESLSATLRRRCPAPQSRSPHTAQRRSRGRRSCGLRTRRSFVCPRQDTLWFTSQTTDDDDGQVSSVSAESSAYSVAPGDSVLDSQDEFEHVEPIAHRSRGSASCSGPATQDEEESKLVRRVRDTTPQLRRTIPAEDRERLRSDALNEREDVGNVGMMFGSWGGRSTQKRLSRQD